MKTISLTKHNQDEDVVAAADFLDEGGVVLLPTDTSYGLAADATNAEAVGTVFELKGRPSGQALSVIVEDREQAEKYGRFSAQAARLWDRLLPGPLTLVLPYSGTDLAAEAVEDNAVGLRQPDYPFTQLVAERFGRAYTATSANRSGDPPAYSVDEFLSKLPEGKAPHLVIDAGTLPIRPVSTVVRVTDSVEIIRPGAVDEAAIMKAVSEEAS